MRKTTNEEYKKMLNDLGNGEYTLISNYNGADKKVTLRHKCGHEYSIYAGEFKRGNGRCSVCRKKRLKEKKFREFKQKLEALYPGEYTVLSTKYETSHDKLKFIHNVCHHEVDASPNTMLRQPVCSFCHGGIPKTDKEFRKQVKDLVGDEYIFLEPYDNSGTKIKCRHNTCNFEWDVRPNDFLHRNVRCPKCNDNLPTDEAEFKKELFDVWGDTFTVLGKYTKKHAKLKIRCNKCNNEWYPEARRLLEGHGCPECKNKSVGERLIKAYLASKNIDYIHGYVLPNRLHLDFYFPSLRVGIEYDGIQHYQPRELFGGRTVFEAQQKRDWAKDVYCAKRGIKLIRIPYTINTLNKITDYLESKCNFG